MDKIYVNRSRNIRRKTETEFSHFLLNQKVTCQQQQKYLYSVLPLQQNKLSALNLAYTEHFAHKLDVQGLCSLSRLNRIYYIARERERERGGVDWARSKSASSR